MAPALDALTADHAAVYDRQIRVWGVEVQRRLMEAKVLIIGLGGLGAEIAKNIVLAGVGTVALRDDSPATSAAPGNFLVDPDSAAGKSVAEACAATLAVMNPLMEVRVEPGPPHVAALLPGGSGGQEAREALKSMVSQYDVVVGCGLGLREVDALDGLCREAGGVELFAGAVRGGSSFVFVDLGPKHTYTVKGKEGDNVVSYCTFQDAMASDLCTYDKRTHPLYLVLRACWEFEQSHSRPAAGPDDVPAVRAVAERLAAATPLGLKVLPAGLVEGFVVDTPKPPPSPQASGHWPGYEAAGGGSLGELAPVCAIVGGVVANDVLRAVSRVNAPLRNLFCYSYVAQGGLGVEGFFGV